MSNDVGGLPPPLEPLGRLLPPLKREPNGATAAANGFDRLPKAPNGVNGALPNEAARLKCRPAAAAIKEFAPISIIFKQIKHRTSFSFLFWFGSLEQSTIEMPHGCLTEGRVMMRMMSKRKGRWMVMMVVRWRCGCHQASRRQGHGGRVMLFTIPRMMNRIGQQAASRHRQRIRWLTTSAHVSADARLEDRGSVIASWSQCSGGRHVSDGGWRTRQRDARIVWIDERFSAGTERSRTVGVIHQQIDIVVGIVPVRTVIGSMAFVACWSTSRRRSRRIIAAVVMASVSSHSPVIIKHTPSILTCFNNWPTHYIRFFKIRSFITQKNSRFAQLGLFNALIIIIL